MVVAIIQARMSSTRLPGKVLKEVNEMPILGYEINRIKQAKRIDKIVIATSVNMEDDPLASLANDFGVGIYRGDLNNVLDRYYQCAMFNEADVIVRLTGDCPVIDPMIIDNVIKDFFESESEYCSNCLNRTFPDGLDVEVFSMAALEKVKRSATTKNHLEHVTQYISENRAEFKITHHLNDIDYSYIRWTLDTPSDFLFFKNLIEHKSSNNYSWKELLRQSDTEKYLIDSNQTIRYAMKKLEEVIDNDGDSLYVMERQRIIGTVSAGDIRRRLIYDDITNNEQISQIANRNFHFLKKDFDYSKKDFNELSRYKFLPEIDKEGNFIQFKEIQALLSRPNRVVLMAGGLGNRLKSITESTPKPMLKIGGKPILETIIDQYTIQNFNNFYISVKHFSDQIIDFFEDGASKSVNIKYLEETKRLGTAGCLSLIEEKLNDPFFVMNGDIITDLNFSKMLGRHNQLNNEITIATVWYEHTIPYGVIQINDLQSVSGIEEKPVHKSMISAGVYILNPELLNEIPENEYFDIPELFKKLIKENRKVGTFEIENYWLDIGHPEDYYRAQNEFEKLKI